MTNLVFAILSLVIFVGFLGVFIYNRFILLRNFMKEALSGIDVQLKRRHDLIPNMVEAVKGYQQHEQALMEKIARLRMAVSTAEDVGERKLIETELSRTFKSFLALAEAYPDLKANTNFLELQKTLAAVEDDIQMSRRYYNGTVRNYNILGESFPGNVVAGIARFQPEEYFEIEYATERRVPDVRFDK